MIAAIGRAVRRFRVVHHLTDLLHPVREWQIREELASDLDRLVPRGLAEGWTASATAAAIAALFVARAAEGLDGPRRGRIAEVLSGEGGDDHAALDWLSEVQRGRINTVGMDTFLYRYRSTLAVLAHWSATGRINPALLSAYGALVGRALSGPEAVPAADPPDDVLLRLGRGSGFTPP